MTYLDTVMALCLILWTALLAVATYYHGRKAGYLAGIRDVRALIEARMRVEADRLGVEPFPGANSVKTPCEACVNRSGFNSRGEICRTCNGWGHVTTPARPM